MSSHGSSTICTVFLNNVLEGQISELWKKSKVVMFAKTRKQNVDMNRICYFNITQKLYKTFGNEICILKEVI